MVRGIGGTCGKTRATPVGTPMCARIDQPSSAGPEMGGHGHPGDERGVERRGSAEMSAECQVARAVSVSRLRRDGCVAGRPALVNLCWFHDTHIRADT